VLSILVVDDTPTHSYMKWLTTNGLGGYASGTVCGANTC